MKLLKKLTSEELKEIISRLSDQGVDELSSIIFNGIYCDVGLSKEKQARLRRSLKEIQKDLQFISQKSNSVKERRKRMLKPQTGSGIGKKNISCFINILSNHEYFFLKVCYCLHWYLQYQV